MDPDMKIACLKMQLAQKKGWVRDQELETEMSAQMQPCQKLIKKKFFIGLPT